MNLRRKRMILMRDVWYGYNRTASGNPIKLEAAKRLRKLTIYGNTVQSNLPEGYTQVEYLQSTGTQWIVTDITSDQDTGIYLEAAFDELLPAGSHDASGYRLIGCVNNNFGIGEYPGTGEFNFMRKNGVGATVNSNIGVTADTAKHTFKNNYLNDGLFVVDDTEKTAPEATFTNNYGMAIFRTTYNSATKYYNDPCKAKIYRIKISQGAEVVHDIFPCTRDIDSKPGMYDTMTDTFMTNAGTGEFTAGAEVMAEPTPDTPVDIQLCGDRTGNLLSSEWEQGNIDSAVGINTPSSDRIRTIDYIKCEPNTAYTFYSPYYTTGVRYYNDDKEYMDFEYTQNSTLLHFTTPESTKYLRFITENSPIPDVTLPYMLLKGTYTAETIPAYEPYGYKVSGRTEGLNLLDYDVFEAGAISGSTGTDLDNSLSIRTGTYIEICPNTRYHISFAESLYLRIIFYASDKSFISQIYVASGSYSFTTPDQTFYIRLSLQGINNQLEPSSIQAMLVQGYYTADTIPPYEPYQPPQDFAVYLPQQIAKVGDVADTVVLDMEQRTATLVQNCFEYYVTGEENTVAPGGNNSGDCYGFLLPIDRKGSATPMLSDRYQIAYTSVITPLAFDDVTIIIGGMGKYVYFYLPFTKYTDLDTFKTYLQEQNNAGDPITILCIRNTPVTTDITAMQDWDAMPQVKGTVTLTLSAEVEPSGAEAVYYSAERGD